MIEVFLYHSVEDSETYRYAVTTENFRQQLLAIKKRFKIVSKDEFKLLISGGAVAGGNYALVTFDDGYEDNYVHAFPILKELNIPALIFVSTKWIGTEFNGKKMLNWEQIREMDRSGIVAFGNHTHSHVVLTSESEDSIREELQQANIILERELGKKVDSMSYPKNKVNEIALDTASQLFSFSFGGEGIVFNKVDNKFLIPRINIGAKMEMFKFRLICNKWYWFLKKIKKIK